MEFSIEHLSFEELASFLRVQAEDAFPDLKDEQRLNSLAKKWSDNADFCTCRAAGGMLVGMIAFYANRPEDLIAYIPHVYVSAEYRGQRVFSSMLHLVETNVKEKGFRFLRLEVKKTNKIAQKVYLSYGFSIISDPSIDSYYMQYIIKTY